jgi:intron-binding protein aquarius
MASHRPYELLRTPNLRTEYLLSKQARIVAMTSTHAAIAREKMIDLGFKYDRWV